MKILKLLLISILFFSGALFSESITKSGTTAAPFLKIGIGPRAVAMGSAFTAMADDFTAAYWNPAGLANNNSNDAYFNHVDWMADISIDYAGFSSNIEGIGTIGAFVTVLNSIEGMMVRTVENPEGTGEKFDAGAMSVGISFGRYLTDNFSIGFNAKYIREHIWHESAVGFALDVGVLYKINILNEFRLGASISNFGTKMKMEGRDILEIFRVGEGDANLINSTTEMGKWDLPLLFRVGVAADLVKNDDMRFTAAVDAVHPNDHTEYINTGFEYSWNELIFVRGGYNSLFERDGVKGLTVGLGLNYRIASSMKVLLDYAYEDFGRLTEVHYFSFGVKF